MTQTRSVVSEDDLVLEADVGATGQPGDIILKTSGVERARLRSDGTGTGGFGDSLALTTYRLTSDGTTVNAYNKLGARVSSRTDTALVLADVVALLPSGNGTVTARDDGAVYPWASTYLLPTGVTKGLTIDFGGSTQALTGGLNVMLDWNRTADYQTFQKITLRNGVFDGTGMTGTHALIGANKQRANFQDLLFEKLKFINMPQPGDGSIIAQGIVVNVSQLAISEGTQNVIQRIVCRDIEMDGGSTMILIAATGGSAPGLNVLVDKIHIERWRHDVGSVQTNNFGSAHIQIGSKAQVGDVYIGPGYGRGAADVGVETDCGQNVVVHGVTVEDSFGSSFLNSTFNNYIDASSAQTTYIGCTARKVAQTVVNWRGFVIQNQNGYSVKIPHTDYLGCKVSKRSSDSNTQGWAFLLLNIAAQPGIDTATFVDFTAQETGITGLSSVAKVSTAFSFDQAVGTGKVFARDVKFKLAGDASGATSGYTWYGFNFNTGNFFFEIDDVYWDCTVTTPGSGRQLAVYVCPGGTGTMYGTIDRITVDPGFTGNTNACGVRIQNTANLTIPAKKFILVDRCDFAAIPANREVELVATAQTAVFTKRIIYNTANGQPAPTTLAGLTTATGKVLGTTWDACVQFVQGSGAAITAIDVSTNGGTTYTNVLTQASAAMPAGADLWIGPLRGDSLVKVTFTTTQPTINIVPANL